MNLLYFNLSLDSKDSSLSFTINWLNQISTYYEKVYVITLRGTPIKLNKNIFIFRLYGDGTNFKLFALIKYYYFLFSILNKKIDRCFCHMNPLFLALTIGILRIKKIKTILWYTHPSVTFKLKLASYFSNKIITASKNSFPIKTYKVLPIGHAVETRLFENFGSDKKFISCIGRISKSKNIDVLIRAYYKLNTNIKLLIIGDPLTDNDNLYMKVLTNLVSDLKIKNKVIFKNAVSRNDLVKFYNESIVHVNLTSEGFLDKVALEAMSCGTISLSSNEGYGNVYSNFSDKLLFKYRDEIDLSKKLEKILTMDENERIMIESKLLKNVKKLHSIETIGKRINDVFEII